MPRLIDSATRTDDIILGVARIIVASGIEALTLRNIAREVGISAGSLHHHYESRERLLRVVVHWFAKAFVHEHESRACVEGPSAFLPATKDDVARTRVWLAFGELGRADSITGASIATARADECRCLATSVKPELAARSAIEAYALLEGLRTALCAGDDAPSLDDARSILTSAVARSCSVAQAEL